MPERRLWTESEVKLALGLYLVTPFGRFHSGNPDIIKLSKRIARTPDAVALKLSNLAAIDESLPQKGMANTSKMDRQVWADYLKNPDPVVDAFETFEVGPQYVQPQVHYDIPGAAEGVDLPSQGTQRKGQNFFRRSILTSYENKCALTDVDDQRLLIASHIVGWADDKALRLNPQNGICLNPLHDKAFDRHLITFGDNFELVVSDRLPERTKEALADVKNRSLRMPKRFLPSQEYLQRHRQTFFELQA